MMRRIRLTVISREGEKLPLMVKPGAISHIRARGSYDEGEARSVVGVDSPKLVAFVRETVDEIDALLDQENEDFVDRMSLLASKKRGGDHV